MPSSSRQSCRGTQNQARRTLVHVPLAVVQLGIGECQHAVSQLEVLADGSAHPPDARDQASGLAAAISLKRGIHRSHLVTVLVRRLKPCW